MDAPSLKLTIVKGPRKGETLEFKPGSRVRVGRVVRGNDLCIKDPGISSKHLCIESESGKWVLRDLGSSNGTFLNSMDLSGETPFDLREGDCIKLGETSSLMVNLICGGDEVKEQVGNEKLPPRPRRSNRRQIDPHSEYVQSVVMKRGRRDRTAKQKQENDVIQELSREAGASSAVIVEEKLEEKDVVEKDEKKENSRVKESGKTGIVQSSHLDLDNGRAQEVPRRGRASRRRVIEDTAEEAEASVAQAGKSLNYRMTRSRKKAVDNSASVSEKLEIETRKNQERRKKVQDEPSESPEVGTVADKETSFREETRNSTQVDNNENAENLPIREEAQNSSIVLDKGDADDQTLREEESGGLAKGGNDVKVEKISYCKVNDNGNGFETGCSSGNKEDSSGGLKIDVEKMTLGEWLDYLEVQLPKQIIDETEKMIEAMRNKATRVKEYMREQKGKVPDG